MFTGIIQTTGVILEKTEEQLRVEAPDLVDELKQGDSVAVDGICLTVLEKDDHSFLVDYMPETAQKTNLGSRQTKALVNLELPMKLGGRFDGHMVSGHVDTTGKVTDIQDEGNAKLLTILASESYDRYLIPKGSVTINGISLTVVEVESGQFMVSLIPHTWEMTNLHQLEIGQPVNIEVDMLAKYIEKLTLSSSPESEN